MEDAPQPLRTAAIVHTVSGILTLALGIGIPVFGSTVGTCLITMIAGLLTFWAGGIGAICGYCGFCSWGAALLVIMNRSLPTGMSRISVAALESNGAA